MAAEHITPNDALTGLPLPIIPPEYYGFKDWHHHFHPEKSELLKGDEGGIAVRNARVQKIDKQLHGDYHRYYVGPPLPETDEEKLSVVIMAAAGYLPKEGLIFGTDGTPQEEVINPRLRERMQTSGEIKLDNYMVVRDFLRDHILSQQIESINLNDSTLDQFLTTPDITRRLELGHTFLGLLTEKVTAAVDETYYISHKKSLILPSLPNNVQRFTKTRLGNRRMRDNIVNLLHTQLSASLT